MAKTLSPRLRESHIYDAWLDEPGPYIDLRDDPRRTHPRQAEVMNAATEAPRSERSEQPD